MYQKCRSSSLIPWLLPQPSQNAVGARAKLQVREMPAVCCLPTLAGQLEEKPQEKGDGEVVHTQLGIVRLCPNVQHKIFMSDVVTPLLSG